MTREQQTIKKPLNEVDTFLEHAQELIEEFEIVDNKTTNILIDLGT